MMRWVYNGLVEETVRNFCRRALPEVEDWRNCEYDIMAANRDGNLGIAYKVGVYIPLSSTGVICCLLDFIIENQEPVFVEKAFVRDISAEKNRKEDDDIVLYHWDDEYGIWVYEPDIEEEQ